FLIKSIIQHLLSSRQLPEEIIHVCCDEANLNLIGPESNDLARFAVVAGSVINRQEIATTRRKKRYPIRVGVNAQRSLAVGRMISRKGGQPPMDVVIDILPILPLIQYFFGR